jgi:hypothetical protein
VLAVPPPVEVPTRQSALRKLGIEGAADSLQTGYLRLALATDANPSVSRPQWTAQVVACGDESWSADDRGEGSVLMDFEIGEAAGKRSAPWPRRRSAS